MKTVRKILKVGDSWGITIPKQWIRGQYAIIQKRDGEIILKFLEVGKNG